MDSQRKLLLVATICIVMTTICVQAGLIPSHLQNQTVGHLGDHHRADDKISDLVRIHLDNIQKTINRDIKELIPLTYRSQVVAGSNYYVKCKVIDNRGHVEHIHVKIYEPIGGEPILKSVLMGHTEESPLEFFE